jgi:uncharacterized protein
MSNFITWFEIPVADFHRAVRFYESVFQIRMDVADDDEKFKMAYFPSNGEGVDGALAYAEGYVPSTNGVLLYMNANPDMGALLERVTAMKGTVVVAKTLISEEQGYFGCFLDSENNRIGLHSMQ